MVLRLRAGPGGPGDRVVIVGETTQASGPRCPNCRSEDVAIRGSADTGTAPYPSPLHVWECRTCHTIFAYRLGMQTEPPGDATS